jgi:hypothetical protein
MTDEMGGMGQVSLRALLQEGIEKIASRKDVAVNVQKVGAAVPPAVLKRFEGKWPNELLAFFSEMNGVHFEWVFVGKEGDGCINIAPLENADPDAFEAEPDEDLKVDFGENSRIEIFDAHQDEALTAYVVERGRPVDEGAFYFNWSGEGESPVRVAASVREYLELAVANGFATSWPDGSYEKARITLKHLREPGSRAAPELSAGVRIRIENGRLKPGNDRGVLTGAQRAVDDPPTEAHGTEYQVELDSGFVRWVQMPYITVLRRKDLYERAIADPVRFWESFSGQKAYEQMVQIAQMAAFSESGLPVDLLAAILRKLESRVQKLRDLFVAWVEAAPGLQEQNRIESVAGGYIGVTPHVSRDSESDGDGRKYGMLKVPEMIFYGMRLSERLLASVPWGSGAKVADFFAQEEIDLFREIARVAAAYDEDWNCEIEKYLDDTTKSRWSWEPPGLGSLSE